MKHHTMTSPLGYLTVVVDDQGALAALLQLDGPTPASTVGVADEVATAAAVAQLREYFAGTRTTFDLTLAPAGTEFQRRVWLELQQIGFGETISYGELARRIGQPSAARAVGLANSRNPISIVIPCHRVIGTNGALTGYAGGVGRKRWLLDHEAAVLGAHLLPRDSTDATR